MEEWRRKRKGERLGNSSQFPGNGNGWEGANIRHVYSIRFVAPLLRSAPCQRKENNNQLIRQVGLTPWGRGGRRRTIEINRSEIRASRVGGVGTEVIFTDFKKYRLFLAYYFWRLIYRFKVFFFPPPMNIRAFVAAFRYSLPAVPILKIYNIYYTYYMGFQHW